MSTPITGALVVCVAAAGVAVGALFIEAGGSSPPASSDPASASAPAGPGQGGTGTGTGGNGSNGGYGGQYGNDDTGGGSANPAGASLEISGFQFGAVSVSPGGQVTVANRDNAPHTVTADGGEFDSGEVSGGGTGSFEAPGQPGSYSFQCQIHPDMSGTLTVG